MPTTLIVGAGAGLSASVARALHARGHGLVLCARDTRDLASLADETGARLVDADARRPEDIVRLFEEVDEHAREHGALTVALYNAAARPLGSITELDPEAVENALMVGAYGAFLTARQATPRMIEAGGGTLLFTGASAGMKGYSRSAAFAMAKFALRGLCQSLARELHPEGVHVAHVVIDGGIAVTPQHGRANVVTGSDTELDPGEVARAYLALIDQHRSAWSSEITLRPWTERF